MEAQRRGGDGGATARARPTRAGLALAVLPLAVLAARYRRWHLRWGATADEVEAPMPGDDLVTTSHFTATRAVTIAAPPEEVWPWLVQVGFHRAGFYSYDLLDSLGRPSADHVLPEWQSPQVGDVAAPMTDPPTEATAFVVDRVEPPSVLVWRKPDSTWAWTLTALPGERTRLVTRLRQRYRAAPSALLTIVLLAAGDSPMMRKMLTGLRARAELHRPETVELDEPGTRSRRPGAGEPGPATSGPFT